MQLLHVHAVALCKFSVYYTHIGAGAYAGCAYCTHLGTWSKPLTKVVYPGNRRFLKSDDSLRSDRRNFPKKDINNDQPPKLKTISYIQEASKEFLAASSVAEAKKLSQRTGCKGVSVLTKIKDFDRFATTPIDPMHLIKNIVEQCVNLLSGKEDSRKVRAH